MTETCLPALTATPVMVFRSANSANCGTLQGISIAFSGRTEWYRLQLLESFPPIPLSCYARALTVLSPLQRQEAHSLNTAEYRAGTFLSSTLHATLLISSSPSFFSYTRALKPSPSADSILPPSRVPGVDFFPTSRNFNSGVPNTSPSFFSPISLRLRNDPKVSSAPPSSFPLVSN